jgi:hypothetical protein
LLLDFVNACTDRIVAPVFPRTVSRLNCLQHCRFTCYGTDIGYAILNELQGYDSVGARNRPQVPSDGLSKVPVAFRREVETDYAERNNHDN